MGYLAYSTNQLVFVGDQRLSQARLQSSFLTARDRQYSGLEVWPAIAGKDLGRAYHRNAGSNRPNSHFFAPALSLLMDVALPAGSVK
jgi:hypothetical protein